MTTDRGVSAVRNVFVGGTGRSGTTMLGALLGSHPLLHGIPIETRFQLNLPKVLLEKLTPREYVSDLEGSVLARLAALVPMSDLEDALAVFESTALVDGRLAARRLLHAVLDPMAMRARKPAWVEMTPANMLIANPLSRISPDARFVHVYRDGRDVANSVARTWKRMSATDALEWWARRMKLIERQIALMPAGRCHTLRMEALVKDDREPTRRGLLQFLELEDAPDMSRRFGTEFVAKNANIGRWRQDLSKPAQAAVTRRYVELLEALGEGSSGSLAQLRATVG